MPASLAVICGWFLPVLETPLNVMVMAAGSGPPVQTTSAPRLLSAAWTLAADALEASCSVWMPFQVSYHGHRVVRDADIEPAAGRVMHDRADGRADGRRLRDRRRPACAGPIHPTAAARADLTETATEVQQISGTPALLEIFWK